MLLMWVNAGWSTSSWQEDQGAFDYAPGTMRKKDQGAFDYAPGTMGRQDQVPNKALGQCKLCYVYRKSSEPLTTPLAIIMTMGLAGDRFTLDVALLWCDAFHESMNLKM